MAERGSVRVLGPLELRRGATVVTIGSALQRTLLLRLLVGGGQATTDALIDALWGATPPASARSTLKSHAARLRAALDEVGLELRGLRGCYELALEPEQLDANRFERACEEARGSRRDDAVEVLSSALGLWRGPALFDVRDEPFARADATRLEELRLQALEQLAAAKLACGSAHDVVLDLEPVVQEHPLREQLVAHLAVALYRAGRQADALRCCDALRCSLRDELGLDPSPELQDLELAILEQRAELGPWSGDVRRSPATSLPAPIGPLIGRAVELEGVQSLLREGCRLVVLTGMGGIGKTRLAVEVARRSDGHQFPAAGFVDLSVVGVGEVDAAIASAVAGPRVDWPGDVLDGLCRWLAERDLLLVVDNCEHVVEEVADALDRLLSRCPGLGVLATSRVAIGLTGANTVPVPPLSVGSGASDSQVVAPAVHLFAQRARAARPSFRLDESNREIVTRICAALDGVPLAIELAAARIGHVGTEQLEERLRDRLRFLSDPTRRPRRHQNLEEMVRWSLDLLGERERRMFRRLSVFPGEFDLDAVEGICADDADDADDAINALAALVRSSLMVTVDAGGLTRYRLLEVLRRFAADELENTGDPAWWRRRHAEWYFALAARLEPALHGPEEADLLARLQREHDNMRAALAWLTGHGRWSDAMGLAASLHRFWRARGLVSEGRRWLRQALDHCGDAPEDLRARALHVAGWLAREQGDYAEARSAFEGSLKLHRRLGDVPGTGWALVDLGFLARYESDYVAARAFLQESIPMFQRSGDLEGLAAAVGNVGLLHRDEGDLVASEHHLERSLGLFRQCGDLVGSGWTLTALGMVARAGQRPAAAGARLEEALVLWKRLDDVPNTANVLSILAAVARDQGDLGRASALLGEGLSLQWDVGDRRGLAFSLEGFALVAACAAEPALAVALASVAAALREDLRTPAPPTWSAELHQQLAAATEGCDTLAVASATAEGRAMSLATAVDRALALRSALGPTGRAPGRGANQSVAASDRSS